MKNLKLNIIRNLFLLTFILHCGSTKADISVTDDSGNTITLKSPARNIISLSPGMTELLYAAGGQNYVKGVVSYSDYPEAARRIPQIGSYNALDIEQIVALDPDLVLAWESGNPPLQISKLKKLGITVFLSEPRDFNDIPSTLLRLGKLMDTNAIAKRESLKFVNRLNKLKTRYPKTKTNKKTVFIQIWNQPLMSINGKHLISKIVEQCNGVNIFHDANQLTLTLDTETIIQANPDIILATRLGELGETWLTKWKQWRFMTAVNKAQLYRVNPDWVVRHTPRILDGIEQVCGFLHLK